MNKPLNILFISMEFADPIFSGNGIYSRTLTRILASDPNVIIHVVTAQPKEHYPDYNISFLNLMNDNVTMSLCPVSTWNKLDRNGPWEEFGKESMKIMTEINRFEADIIIGIDWHSYDVYNNIKNTNKTALPPFYYCNFRVYSNSSGVKEDDIKFYKEKESLIINASNGVSCLCKTDQISLTELLSKENKEKNKIKISVIHPCLRYDIEELGLYYIRDGGENRKRKYILCCSRICPEKRIDLFVEIMINLKEKILSKGYIPVLIGAVVDKEYGNHWISLLKHHYPDNNSIVLDFISPSELSNYYKESLFLIHPSTYEAYGMVIAECSVFQCPSIVDKGGDIGVVEMFEENHYSYRNAPYKKEEMIILTNMKNINEVQKTVDHYLDNTEELISIGEKASFRSMSWCEKDLGKVLLGKLKELL